MRISILTLIFVSLSNASYLTVSKTQLQDTVKVSERQKNNRVHLSNSTKLVKMIFMDNKKLSSVTNRQRNTSAYSLH